MFTRLEQLQSYFNEDPRDPFNIYSLALEYLKTDVTKSKELFDQLLQVHPDYLPTYYHAAKLYAELNDKDKAIDIYQRGMAVAKHSNNPKTLRELQSAFDELVFE